MSPEEFALRALPFALVAAFALGCSGAATTTRNAGGGKVGPGATGVDDPPVESDKLEVKVVGKELFVGGKRVPLPGRRQDLIGLLGEPSRVLKKVNTLLVWDELGLFAYERSGDGSVFQFSVALGDMQQFDFWPKKSFTGKLNLDGAAVTADATIDGINRAKKGKPLRPDGFLGFRAMLEDEGVSIAILKARGGRFDAGGSPTEFVIEVTPK